MKRFVGECGVFHNSTAGSVWQPARVAFQSLQIVPFKGGAGNPARQPGTGIFGRLQGDAARCSVNDHEPRSVHPDLIEF
jgi:hypothetical protein